jgi:hypothetical protein
MIARCDLTIRLPNRESMVYVVGTDRNETMSLAEQREMVERRIAEIETDAMNLAPNYLSNEEASAWGGGNTSALQWVLDNVLKEAPDDTTGENLDLVDGFQPLLRCSGHDRRSSETHGSDA